MAECPKECKVRLEHLEEEKRTADKTHNDLFSKINAVSDNVSKRVKTVTLVGLAAVVVLVLGGAFMLLYNQGTSIGGQIGVTHQRINVLGDSIHEVEVQVVAVQEQLKAQKEDIKELKEGP